MTLGERIERSLAIAGMTVKDLERALDGVEGASYANLHRYKSDKKSRPSADLLHAVAGAAGVDPEWLVTGDGEPTEDLAAERAHEGALATEVTTAGPDYVLREIRRGFDPESDPKDARYPDVTPFVRAALFRAWRIKRHGNRRAYVDAQLGGHEIRDVDIRAGERLEDRRAADHAELVSDMDVEAARQVGRSLRSVLDALDTDYTRMDSASWERFALGVAQAIEASAGQPMAPADADDNSEED